MIKLPRPSTHHQQLALKAAFKGALALAGGGDAFVLASRIDSAGTLSKAASPQDPYFIPLDVALDADLAAGFPVIASALAAAQGFALVAKDGDRPSDKAASAAALSMAGIANLIKESSDVGPALMLAVADGTINQAEKKHVLGEIDELMKVLQAARDAVVAA